VADPTGRSAGRGAYVCHSTACIDKAITKGALARALRTPLPADLGTTLAASLTQPIDEGGARGQE